jgi:polysaccharide export outer membrane protein
MKAAFSMKILLAVALTLSAAGCGPSIYETYSYGKEYDPRRHEYIIGVSDQININVYHMPDLSGAGTVRPDGVITMPLIGDVQVAGKTPSQIREEMKKKLSSYVKADTVINVTVTAFNSYRFTVTGNVSHAGSTQPKYYVTVAEAIAAAGGPNKFAGDQIVIFRLDASRKVREIPISYKRLMSGRHPEMDICVVSGDTIVVQ